MSIDTIRFNNMQIYSTMQSPALLQVPNTTVFSFYGNLNFLHGYNNSNLWALTDYSSVKGFTETFDFTKFWETTFKKSNISPCGFSEYIKVDENHLKYTVYKVPDNIEHEEISFLEPLACIVRAIRRAGYELNKDNSKSNALVLGLGSIGFLTVQALKAFGVNAYGYDINNERMEFASRFDISYKKDKYDVIFMTSGSSKAIPTALEHVRDGGKIVVFSSIENEEGYKNNDIYYRELSIIASYSPSPEDYKISYEFLCNKKVNVKGISTVYTLDNLAHAIEDNICGKIFKAYIKI